MKGKIIQADTRDLKLFLETRDLNYGPPNQMDLNYILNINNNTLLQQISPLSLTFVVNLIKCKFMNLQYEFIKEKNEDWNIGDKMGVTWMKILHLIKQMKNPENSDVEFFCWLDSDAWVRDEDAFTSFCQTFLKSDFLIAIPRDIEISPTCDYLNSGFICIKNIPAALEMLERVYTSPEYYEYHQHKYLEQGALSLYYKTNSEKFMVLPLNDFNTPCGRIVRHCWIKHIFEPFILEEAIATLNRIALSLTNDPNLSFGKEVSIVPSK